MDTFARDERHRLAHTLLEFGPAAPTLCEGWTTRDLTHHLVIRDRRPVAVLDAIVPQVTTRIPGVASLAARQNAELEALSFDDLVALMRQGAPVWSPPGWHVGERAPIDALMNSAEFFVHHEDVRRAGAGWTVRSLPFTVEKKFRSNLALMARPVAFRTKRRLVLDTFGFDPVTVGRASAPVHTIAGMPSEILLHLFGRTEVAEVEVS